MRTKTVSLVAFLLFFILSIAHAQLTDPGPGSVTVFSDTEENFTLYLNGEKKNATPATRVVVDNVVEVPVSFRIVFQNSAIPELKKKGLRGGKNCLYAIDKNKKGVYALRMHGCSEESPSTEQQPVQSGSVATTVTTGPAQLSAVYANDIITINDGRTLSVKKVKVNGMTYPRVIMTALAGARVSISYDDNEEKFSGEAPIQYEVKDFSLNIAYLTLTVDEGGPAKTWHVKLKNSNGYDLKIE